MSYTTFTANPAALIAQPGRAVNTFPSGLVRVDQTYLGLTAQAASHRATLAVGNDMPGDSSPCIDGLKIFPEVQEKRREDGFTEYIVSAYGRCNSTGSGYMLGWQRSRSFAWHGPWTTGDLLNPDSNGLVFDCKFSFGNFVNDSTLTKAEYSNVYPPEVNTFTNTPTLDISANTVLTEVFSLSGTSPGSKYDATVPIASSVTAVLTDKYTYNNFWTYEYSVTVILANYIRAKFSDGSTNDQYSANPGVPYNIGTIYLVITPNNGSRTINYFGDFLEVKSVQNFDFNRISSSDITSTIPNQ